MLRTGLVVLLVFVVGMAGVSRASEPPAELVRMQTAYEQALLHLRSEETAQETQLIEAYARKLKSLDTRLKAQGDLEGLVAVRAEKEWADSGNPDAIPSGAVADCPELAGLRERFQGILLRLRTEKSQKEAQLAQTYLDRLAPLKKQMVRQDRLEEARLVKNEMDRVEPVAKTAQVAVEAPPPEAENKKATPVISKKKASAPKKGKVAPASDFEWEECEGGVAITKYLGNERDLVVPEQLGGKPVVMIKEKVFNNKERLRSIVLPDSLKRLGGGAFSGSHNLRHIDLGGGLENLPCLSLGGSQVQELYIPASVKNMWDLFNWFSPVDGKMEVEIAPGSPFMLGEDQMIYTRDGRVLVASTTHRYSFFRVPDGVEQIKQYLFTGAKFERIFLPASVNKIDQCVFILNGDALKGLYFDGDAPSFGKKIFEKTQLHEILYREGAKGWPEEIEGIPTRAVKKVPSWVKKETRMRH